MYTLAVQETPSLAIARSIFMVFRSLFFTKKRIKCDIAAFQHPHEMQEDWQMKEKSAFQCKNSLLTIDLKLNKQ